MKTFIVLSFILAFSCKPSNIIDNYFEKHIPKNTKFKVSDVVCVHKVKQGVVLNIRFSDNPPANHPDVLVYAVKFWNSIEGEFEEFYDTELQAGDCK